MIKIGLTGNIASGKSEVEKIIKNMGFCVYDLDEITHELYQKESVKQKILDEFSTLDRKIISNIVFKDKNKLKKLENIIHPCLREFILNLNSNKTVFISGALLFEAGFDIYFDKIIFVDSNMDLRLLRLIKRNNLSKEEAKRRIEAQNSKFKQKADFIIENNTNLEELKQKTQKLVFEILK